MNDAMSGRRGHEGASQASSSKPAAPAPGRTSLTEQLTGGLRDAAEAPAGAAAAAPRAPTSISFSSDSFASPSLPAGGLLPGGDDEEGQLVGGNATNASTSNTSAPRWTDHGRFKWWIRWATDGTGGWLVQKVTNTYSGTKGDGTAITNASVGAHPVYWECWAVSSTGAITPAAGSTHDMWERPSQGANSKGSWSMRGEVYWTATDPAGSGLTSGGASNAGILVSGFSAPAGIGGVLLTRSANGTWDSTTTPRTHTGSAT